MPKTCKTCGISFHVKPSQFNKKTYCGVECMRVDYRERLRGTANPNYRDALTRTCATCGQSFKVTVHATPRKYCSRDCRVRSPAMLALAERRRNAPRSSRPPAPRKPWVPRPPPAPTERRCVSCSATFYLTRYRLYCDTCLTQERRCVVCQASFHARPYVNRMTCSTRCRWRYVALRQQGKQSHLWRGGRTSEAMLFRTSQEYGEWRTRVYVRDAYTCQTCGQLGGKNLTVHHIKTFGERRDLAMEDWNGITLCWPCHCDVNHHETEHEARFFAITNPPRAALEVA